MEHNYSSNMPGVRLDGSWELTLLVTDLQVEKTLRVRGDHHVGGVMIKLVNELDIAMDWSDHALWWPERNVWLEKTRWTLDQYHITADTVIFFTPMHKNVRIQLPDLRYVDCVLDFSIKAFSALRTLCSDLEIRHFEELSLCKPLATDHLKFNYGDFRQEEEKKRRVTLKNGMDASNSSSPSGTFRRRGKQQYHHNHSVSTSDLSPSTAIVDRPDTNTFIANSTATLGRKSSTTSWNGGGSPSRNYRSLGRNGTMEHHQRRKSDFHTQSNHGTLRKNGSFSPLINGNEVNVKSGSEWSLAMSPPPSVEAKDSLIRPKNLVERARMNVAWLDSSLSLMEQGVKDFDTLLLRYKFYSFYDINPKLDGVRINLIYEQLKWIVLNENIDCTEEEMMLFAALHLQVSLQANVPQPNDDDEDEDDDVDAALSDLQISLEGEAHRSFINDGVNTDMVAIPVLSDYLRYMRPKRFTLKGYKRHYFVLKELALVAYKNQEDSYDYQSSFSVNLKGCEVSPEVNISRKRYGIKLAIPSADGMSDLYLRCSSEDQYSKWMAACRLAAKGKTMADPSYDSEVKSILAFLSMQHPASTPVINPSTLNVDVEEYVASRFLRKVPKSKLRQRILEAHSNVKDLNLIEAKMNYLKAFQSLPDYGVSLFVVRFHGEKKDELLGIAYNRLMRMNLQTGDPIKTWRYNTIKAWNINWETKHMMIQLGDGKNVIFKCLSADCKVVHEFIGGYIFLSMRNRDLNQGIDEELFHKLTGGWH